MQKIYDKKYKINLVAEIKKIKEWSDKVVLLWNIYVCFYQICELIFGLHKISWL